MGGVTYSVQYTTDSKETLQKYYIEDAPALREEGEKLFGEKMLSFRTELEVDFGALKVFSVQSQCSDGK